MPDDPQALRQQRVASMLRAHYARHCEARGYQFTRDWFSHNLQVWHHVLRPLADTPDLRAVEIGCWEGRATCWLLDNILTHPSAAITCIDTFEGSAEHQRLDEETLGSVRARFDANIARTGAAHRVTTLVGRSQDLLRALPLASVDLLYVDGSHTAPDVLEDAVLGWRLMKTGGLVLFDDYQWSERPDDSTEHPRPAIDAFLHIFRDRIAVVHVGYQVIVRKTQE